MAISLKSLVPESAVWEGPQPSPLLGKYILRDKTGEFSGALYHGSPYQGLYQILTHKIYGQEHGEVSEHESFSTSVNPNILHYFSEGDGETGLEFEVKNIKVVVLDQYLTFLVTQLAGSGFDAEIDDEEKFEKFCNAFRIPSGTGTYARGNYYLPYNYLSSLGVDAFTFDYVWRRWQSGMNSEYNQESEVCFIGKGIDVLNKSITRIFVDGEEFEDRALAIQALKEKASDKT